MKPKATTTDPDDELSKAVRRVNAELLKQGKILGCLFVADVEGPSCGILFPGQSTPESSLSLLHDLKQTIVQVEEFWKGKLLEKTTQKTITH